MTIHRVASITWLPRAKTAPMSCTCGWTGIYRVIPNLPHSDTFSQHRAEAGMKRAHLGDGIRTPDSGSFMPRWARRVETCPRNHDANWREHDDGRRSCVTCQRLLERERRAEERERIKSARAVA